MKDMTMPNSLVLDLGTANTKVGWSNKGEPTSVFPTLVGRGRHKGAMLNLGLKDSYIGRQAQNLRGILSLNAPIRNGTVENWDDLETLWSHIWEKESAGVKNSDEELNVLISVPPMCPKSESRRIAEIVLESSGVAGVYLANKSVLSMYGGGRTTGVCIDSGEDTTYIVPCWEGSPLPDATRILRLGGGHVTDRLLALLSDGKYSFPDDTFLLWKKHKNGKKMGGRGLCVASRQDVVREAKERFCKVAPKKYNDNDYKNIEEEVLRLPDGNIVVVGHESYSAPELLFRPEMVVGNKTSVSTGLSDLVFEAVMQCDEKLRGRLLTNIMLTGGNSLIPGLDKRLAAEVSDLFKKKNIRENANHPTTVRVQAQAGREHFTWDGGAHLCSLSSFQRLWLTKADYAENGDADVVQADDLKNLNMSNGDDDIVNSNDKKEEEQQQLDVTKTSQVL